MRRYVFSQINIKEVCLHRSAEAAQISINSYKLLQRKSKIAYKARRITSSTKALTRVARPSDAKLVEEHCSRKLGKHSKKASKVLC